jgi:hypothetical protein
MRSLLFTTLLLCLCGVASAQSGTRSAAEGVVKEPSVEGGGLELTTTTVEQQYCSSSAMVLTLKLSFKNASGGRLVLFKYGNAPHAYLISRSAEAAAAKEYEQVVSPMMGGGTGSIPFGDEPPPTYFVILQPEETYSPPNTIKVPVFIGDEGDAGSQPDEEGGRERGLGSGQHALQIKVNTWPFHTEPPSADLRARWERFGNLWAKPLLSRAMKFQVQVPYTGPLSNCNSSEAQHH